MKHLSNQQLKLTDIITPLNIYGNGIVKSEFVFVNNIFYRVCSNQALPEGLPHWGILFAEGIPLEGTS
jgi:hypothetical protein